MSSDHSDDENALGNQSPTGSKASSREDLAIPGGSGGATANPSQRVQLPPAPVNARLERRLQRLRRQLTTDLQVDVEEDEDEEVVRGETVDDYVEEAKNKIPVHDALLLRMRAILATATTAQGTIQASLQYASAGMDIESNLGLANKTIERWYKQQLPALELIFDELPVVWYHPGKEDPALDDIEVARRDMDVLSQQVKRARAKAGLTSEAAKGTAATMQLKAPLKIARLVDVGPFLAKFSGDGSAKEALQRFQTWKRDWAACRKYLEEECSGCDEEVLLLKLRKTLEGTAEELVAAIPAQAPKGLDKAIEALDSRYGDAVAIAAAFLDDLREPPKGMAVEKVQQLKDNFAQLATVRQAVQGEGLDPLEFVAISNILAGLSSTAKNSWKARVLELREDNRAANAAKTDATAKVPWTRALAINVATFTAWYEGHVTATAASAEDDNNTASNFLAGASGSQASKSRKTSTAKEEKCLFHPEQFHPTVECRKLGTVASAEYREVLRAAGRCYGCVSEEWQPGHRCAMRCTLCKGRHMTARCGKEKKPAAPSHKPAASSSRGRQDVSAEFREIKSGMAAIVKALVKKEPESKESGGNGNKSHEKRSRSKSADKASKKPKPSKK